MSVMTLAERVCPECQGDGQHQSMGPHDIRVEECVSCNGTGALVPGLRHRCHNFNSRYRWCDGEIIDGRCSCGAHYKRRHKKLYDDHADCPCLGREWVLIPQAEQMGVLIRVREQSILYQAVDG